MEVIDCIRVGHENAVSRRDLCIMTGKRDRQVRKEIQRLRATLPIINSGDGYFLPNSDDLIDKAEATRYLLTERAKANEIYIGLTMVQRFIDGLPIDN